MDSNKNTVMSNLIWRFAERSGAQIVAFVVSIVLARILSPNDYGTIALITVFITILQVFVDSGLGNALIQKKDADDVDFSTVFYTNIVFCLVLYGVIFALSPLIARFYNDVTMVPLIRVLSLTVLVSGVKNVQQAYVSRHMLFRKFFFSTLGGTLTAAVVGIALAYRGFGVWALVAQQVINVTVDTCVLWLTVQWRPKMLFSIQRLKGLFSFGWKLLVSGLLDTVYNNVRQLIIGKLYSSSDLAYFNQGQKIPNLIVANINSSIDSVLLPAMSSVQDDTTHVKSMTRRSIKTSVYIMAPLMMGLAFMAPVLVRLVLTEKWLPCVPFLRIFCVTFMFHPIHTANLNAIKAMGRSDLFLKLEVIKKIMGIVVLVSTMWHGVIVMAYSMLVCSIINQIINSWPNRKLLGYGYLEQLKDILPSIILAVIMGICIQFVSLLMLPDVMIVVIQILLGMLIYFLGSVFFKMDSFEYVKSLMKSLLHK